MTMLLIQPPMPVLLNAITAALTPLGPLRRFGDPPSDLLNPEWVAAAVQGVDALIYGAHEGAVPAGGPEVAGDFLDWAERGLYNAGLAAVDAGVRHFVYLSSLQVFAAAPEGVAITEDWAPRPPAEPVALAAYLGEQVVLQLARSHEIAVTCLRLAPVISPAAAPDTTPPAWLHAAAAAAAVALAIQKPIEHRGRGAAWRLYHICSGDGGGRFPFGRARRALGYEPGHDP